MEKTVYIDATPRRNVAKEYLKVHRILSGMACRSLMERIRFRPERT